ncbi:MAG: type II secretion system protein [Patescibacteria group bacterium]
MNSIQHKNQQKSVGQKAFTLIELLVVIAIIGILSSVVLASLNTARAKGRDARRVSDIKQIQLALELYADQNLGRYPTTLCTGTGCVAPTYISTLPTDPSAGASYAYAALGATSCTGYHLGAILEQNNPTLTGDADGVSTTGVCPSGGTNFAGLSSACTTASAVADNANDRCFDVVNQ